MRKWKILLICVNGAHLTYISLLTLELMIIEGATITTKWQWAQLLVMSPTKPFMSTKSALTELLKQVSGIVVRSECGQ